MSTANDLVIPEAARDAWFHCGCEKGCSRSGYQAEALPVIVAAELRRQADLHQAPALDREPSPGDAVYLGTCDEIADALRRRADELDGGAA